MKMDRAYFKEKHTGKKAGAQMTKCCNQSRDRDILNKKNPEDWELMEAYCEKSLSQSSGTESIEIVCCKKCGRLMKYVSILRSEYRAYE